ncbi:hypothetical protein RCA23_c24820 [Planktomarina temperata RCA23]|uniref:Uncharacterized protein n=1 Tax=Planktomarina temperata RCA23 TaxID=666509 RepID=A0AAN0RKR6_9RHOB|nr:hypothetical protein RCA23_c24820 [Planktomarina temperata RCA23]
MRRWLSLLEKPLCCFDCSSKAIIWISRLRLICLGGGLPIKDRQCSKSSSRPAVSNAAISIPMSLLPLTSLTEQSPRAFGHINTQAYGKTKVQSEEELSEVRLPMLKWMRLRVPWRQKLEA